MNGEFFTGTKLVLEAVVVTVIVFGIVDSCKWFVAMVKEYYDIV